jgi:hypothetical protein
LANAAIAASRVAIRATQDYARNERRPSIQERRSPMQINGESVVAESGTQFDFDFLALPGNRRSWVPKWGFKTEAPTFDPRFDIGGQFGGWHYGVKAYAGYGGEIGSDKEAKRGPAVNEYCDFAGVFGTGIYVTGVAGTSVNNIGVYGQAGEGPIGDFLGGGVVGASFEQVGVFTAGRNWASASSACRSPTCSQRSPA